MAHSLAHSISWKTFLAVDRFGDPIFAIQRPSGTPYTADSAADAAELTGVGAHGARLDGSLVEIDSFVPMEFSAGGSLIGAGDTAGINEHK